MHGLFLQVMREVGWVIFDEIHYMRDPGTVFFVGGVGSVQSQHSIKQLHFNVADKGLNKLFFTCDPEMFIPLALEEILSVFLL